MPVHRDSHYTESEVSRGSISCFSSCGSLSAAAPHTNLSLVTKCCSERSRTWFENCCLTKRSQMSPTLPLKRAGQTLVRQKSSKFLLIPAERKQPEQRRFKRKKILCPICVSFESYLPSKRSLLNSSSLYQQIESTGIAEVTNYCPRVPHSVRLGRAPRPVQPG